MERAACHALVPKQYEADLIIQFGEFLRGTTNSMFRSIGGKLREEVCRKREELLLDLQNYRHRIPQEVLS